MGYAGDSWRLSAQCHSGLLFGLAGCILIAISKQWKPFARLVLEAAYEATLHVALINTERTGNRQEYLTLPGGGAFGNDSDWIMVAIERAARLFSSAYLDISIVSYRASNSDVQRTIDRLR